MGYITFQGLDRLQAKHVIDNHWRRGFRKGRCRSERGGNRAILDLKPGADGYGDDVSCDDIVVGELTV